MDGLLERVRRLPVKLGSGRARVAAERSDVRQFQQRRVLPHEQLPFVDPDMLESHLEQVPQAVGLTRRHDIVIRFVGLKHQQHGLGVVGGVAPVSAYVEVSEDEFVLKSRLIQAAPLVIFRVMKSAPRRGLSWLLRCRGRRRRRTTR